MASEASRSETVRVRVAKVDLDCWKAMSVDGNVSGWLRGVATAAASKGSTVAGSELARGVPVEVVEVRSSEAESRSWREAAGEVGLAPWLRSVASAELDRLGAPVPADVKLPDGAGDSTAAPVALPGATPSPATPSALSPLRRLPLPPVPPSRVRTPRTGAAAR